MMKLTRSVGQTLRWLCWIFFVSLYSTAQAEQTVELFDRNYLDLFNVTPTDLWVDELTYGNSLSQRVIQANFASSTKPTFEQAKEINLEDLSVQLVEEEQIQIATGEQLSTGEFDAQSTVELGLDGNPLGRPKYLHSRIWQDHVHFFSPKSIAMTAGVFAVGSVIANSNLDTSIQQHVHSSLQHANTDDWLQSLRANKEVGNGKVTIPIFAAAWAVGSLLPDGTISETSRNWGERSIRGFLVGAPAVIVLQMATGGSRPGESAHDSEWKPFQDNNGVSGHAFMGALPFITAAKMSESIGMKTLFYGASTLPGLSRTGEAAHYPSQVMLGWWMAYMAATAVDMTDNPKRNWTLYPMATANSTGMAFEYKF